MIAIRTKAQALDKIGEWIADGYTTRVRQGGGRTIVVSVDRDDLGERITGVDSTIRGAVEQVARKIESAS